jgi:hypothetical protein
VVEEAMIRLIYKPVSILASVLGGVLAGIIFKRIWQLAARKATDARRGWQEVLPAAALQGAVVGLVKAAAGCGAAHGAHKLTGVWPGENGQQTQQAAQP